MELQKINFEKKVSEIHKDELTKKDVIIAKRKGKTVGTIIYGACDWINSVVGEVL